jgi:hypothetical protein
LSRPAFRVLDSLDRDRVVSQQWLAADKALDALAVSHELELETLTRAERQAERDRALLPFLR